MSINQEAIRLIAEGARQLSNGSTPLEGIDNEAYNDTGAESSADRSEDTRSRQDGLEALNEESNRRLGEFDDELNAQTSEWDVFEETTWENLAHADRKFWSRVHTVSRLVLIIFLFVFVLGLSSLSSFTFLIIVYNMNASSHNYTLSNNASGHSNPLPNGQLLQDSSDVVDVRWVWAAMMVTSSPYLFTLISCVRKMCVKRMRSLPLRPLLMALVVETLHSVGLGVFVFMVAPSYDPLMVITLSQAVVSVPAALKVKRVSLDDEETHYSWRYIGVLVGALTFVALVVYRLHHSAVNPALAVATPLSLIFLSTEWWENFIYVKHSWKRLRRREMRRMTRDNNAAQQNFVEGSFLFRAKCSIRDRKTRNKIEAVCSVWKIFLNMVIPTVLFASRGSTLCVSALFFTEDSAGNCSLWNQGLSSSRTVAGDGTDDLCSRYLPFLVATASIVASGLAYKAAKVSCKIHAQRLCFALPLILSSPLTCVVTLVTYRPGGGLEFLGCSSYLKWPLLVSQWGGLLEFLGAYSEEYWLPLFFLGLLTLALTAAHVWSPSSDRVASTETLFVRPLYCGVMFAQSLMLNRAVDDTQRRKVETATDDWKSRFEKQTERCQPDEMERVMKDSSFPMIYACATMWHENATEMTQLLKSLFRMDQDQFTRACMWKMFNVVDKDFYNFEAHIFFDDAFKEKHGNFEVNSYVRQFLQVINEAAGSIYPSNATLLPPTKTDTPYGGRLTFTLPGCNQLVVHLKNKKLVRNKKRWSQVMYMYYLLSHKLLLGKHSGSKLADNTFLLALDGDVDFYPDAVQLLVDRMKRDKHVGAACSRIHPIGSGLMVWYQKFEYAVSHWLQKATEHMFGCVLCSPGCFSLFRGSALMKDNVLRRYTRLSTTGRHAVQYDMGEDRWLCTLLLQQGKRVEYVAAADALTFCPDNFQDFYKQRRRWTPSTMANILDLLSDWRHVTKVNGSVSLAFIIYQEFLFVSSMVTPGTIFLLILGAINTAYPSIPLYGAMMLNLLPVAIFVVLCFTVSGDVQIFYATILSTLYSLVMMVVVVGLLRQIAESGMCSITAIFFVGVAVIFCLAALLHPQEATLIFYGLIYFLAIPSMSMLLVFYAVANLNVVSWGTRDQKVGTTDDANRRQGPKGSFDRLQKGLKNMIAGGGVPEDLGDVTSEYTFSFGNLFRCICCPTKKGTDYIMERFDGIEDSLYELRKAIKGDRSEADAEEGGNQPTAPSGLGDWSGSFHVRGDRVTSNPLFCDNEQNGAVDGGQSVPDRAFWFEDPMLDSGQKEDLDAKENKFWEELIEKYLKPLDQVPEHNEKAIEEDLTNLRNKAAMFFFLGNTLFVTVIFILESVSEYTPGLTIELPCDKGHAGQKIEPISVTFTVTFGILLLLQLVGMLMHRYSTFVHIAASATVRPRKEGSASENYNLYGQHEYYYWTMDVLHLDDHNQDPGSTYTSNYGTVRSVSDDTVIDSDRLGRDIVSRLKRRQVSRNESMKRQNLLEIASKGILPLINAVEHNATAYGGGEFGARHRSEDEHEHVEEADMTESEYEGTEYSGEDRTSDVEAAPAASRSAFSTARAVAGWSRARSMKVVMAMDSTRRDLIRERAKTVQKKWRDTAKQITNLGTGKGVTGPGGKAGGGRTREGGEGHMFANIVAEVRRQQARGDSAEEMAGNETAQDTRENEGVQGAASETTITTAATAATRTTSTVSFDTRFRTKALAAVRRRAADPEESISHDASSSLRLRDVDSGTDITPLSPVAERQAPGGADDAAAQEVTEGRHQPEMVEMASVHLPSETSMASLSLDDSDDEDDDEKTVNKSTTQL